MHYDRNRRNGDPLYVRKIAKGCPCTMPGCSYPILANKLCSKHNGRLQRHGDPNYTNPKCNRDGNYITRARKYNKQWKKDNWDYYKIYLAARKERVKQATPPWVDLKVIEDFYRGCPKGYHVDHIEPINGKDRCGLHVIANLQYLPALENLRKSNKT